MQDLPSSSFIHIQGGQFPWPPQPIHYAMLGTGLITGTALGSAADLFSPCVTLIGTCALGATGWAACQPYLAPPNAFGCVALGGLGGYLFAGAVVETALAVLGFGAGVAGSYYLIQRNR